MNEQAYEDRIIDVDFHMHIPYVKLIPYIEDPFIKKTIEEHGPPRTSRPLVSTYAQGGHTTESHDRLHGIAANREEIREVCDELAIDVPIVQAGTNLPIGRNNYPEIANALTRAYNDFALDRCVDVDDEILMTLFLPHWDVEFALDELDRIGSEKAVVAAQTWVDDYKYFGHPDYDPIYEKLDDLDLNLILHVSSTMDPWNGMMKESHRSICETDSIQYGAAAMANAANMVISGVFEKYPNLNVSIQECGMNWLPFLAYTLDERYQVYGHDVAFAERLREKNAKRLERLPSQYVFDHITVSTQPSPYPNIPRTDHAEAMLKVCQAEKTFIYTSDWPHLTMDPVQWLYDIPTIDDEMRARILHKNAENFLRMPN